MAGSIEKRGASWRVRWYDPGGKHRSKTFARKIDAERWLVRVTHDMLTGAYVDPGAGKVTFREVAEGWRAMKVHAASTREQVDGHFRRHVYPTLGEMPIAAIRPSHVQGLVNQLGMKLAPATVEVIYAYLANVFKLAVRDQLIVRTPCVDVDLPKRQAGQLQLLTTDQVAAAAGSIYPRFRIAVVLGAGAGLRPGEVLGLTVDRVDFLRRVVTVDRQLYTPNSGRPRLIPPKTVASHRTVPIPESVVDALAAHLAVHEPGPHGLIVTSRQRQPVRRERYNDAWRVTRRTLGLPGWATPHDLRHYYASLLIAQGLDVKSIQSLLGHKSAVTTLDTYGHIWPKSEDRTRAAVELELGAHLRGYVMGTDGYGKRGLDGQQGAASGDP